MHRPPAQRIAKGLGFNPDDEGFTWKPVLSHGEIAVQRICEEGHEPQSNNGTVEASQDVSPAVSSNGSEHREPTAHHQVNGALPGVVLNGAGVETRPPLEQDI